MKKGIVISLIFGLFLFLGGCADDDQVAQLKQQNNLLQEQIKLEKQAQENTTTNYGTTPAQTTNYNTSTPNSNYDTAPSQTTNYNTTNYDTSSNQNSCCKICSTGKACGDSCISRSYTCHKGPGCACDG